MPEGKTELSLVGLSSNELLTNGVLTAKFDKGKQTYDQAQDWDVK